MRFSTLIILIVIIGVAALVAWKMGYIGKAQKSVEESFITLDRVHAEVFIYGRREDCIQRFNQSPRRSPPIHGMVFGAVRHPMVDHGRPALRPPHLLRNPAAGDPPPVSTLS